MSNSNKFEENDANKSLLTNEELIQKQAVRRAKKSLQNDSADYGVGFAEGVVNIGGIFFTSAWCALVSNSGSQILSGGIHIALTQRLIDLMNNNALSEKHIEEFLSNLPSNPYETLLMLATYHDEFF